MKITVKRDPNVTEPEITVVCASFDNELAEAISYISLSGSTVTGMRGSETFFIPLHEVLYFETVDRKVFFYTALEQYETAARLYQLEERLANTQFARISKSVIANLRKIRSIKPDGRSRLLATLSSGERLIVSRQYLIEIKQKLGV